MKRQSIILRRGESRVWRAGAGNRWRVARGSIRLADPPRWLGERIVQVDAMLRGGETHAVDAGGWVTLHALADSAIEFEAPDSAWASWAMRWRIVRSARARRAVA